MNRYAAIDIGSNTILLLIGEITSQNTLRVLMEAEETTRLGRGLRAGGSLNPSSVQESIAVLKQYVSLCRQEGVDEIVAVATNPLRIADDAEEFVQLVTETCDLVPQIIDASREAYLSYVAVKQDPQIPRSAVVIDVGGGSSEYILPGPEFQAVSLPLGAVGLTERFLHTDPPTSHEVTRLLEAIEKQLVSLPAAQSGELVGIGGTAVTLGAMHVGQHDFNRSIIHGMRLSRREIEAVAQHLLSLPLSARQSIPGLPPSRADIISAGAMVILLSMKRFHKQQIQISCHGLRYGLIYDCFTS